MVIQSRCVGAISISDKLRRPFQAAAIPYISMLSEVICSYDKEQSKTLGHGSNLSLATSFSIACDVPTSNFFQNFGARSVSQDVEEGVVARWRRSRFCRLIDMKQS